MHDKPDDHHGKKAFESIIPYITLIHLNNRDKPSVKRVVSSFLIDTDVAIDFLRGYEYARNLILPLWQSSSAFLSILSTYELYAGMKEKETESTDSFINACNIEPLTLEITN